MGAESRAGGDTKRKGAARDYDPITDKSPSCVQGSWRRPGAQGGHRAAHLVPGCALSPDPTGGSHSEKEVDFQSPDGQRTNFK